MKLYNPYAHQWKNLWTCSVARYRVPTSSFRRFSYDLVGTSYRALEFGSIINCLQTYHHFYYDRDECRNYTPCSRIWFNNLQKKIYSLQINTYNLQDHSLMFHNLQTKMWNVKSINFMNGNWNCLAHKVKL